MLRSGRYLRLGVNQELVFELTAAGIGLTTCSAVDPRARVLDPLGDAVPVAMERPAREEADTVLRFRPVLEGPHRELVYTEAIFLGEVFALSSMSVEQVATLPVGCEELVRAPSGAPLCLSQGDLLLADAGRAWPEPVAAATATVDGVWIGPRTSDAGVQSKMALMREGSTGALEPVTSWRAVDAFASSPIAGFSEAPLSPRQTACRSSSLKPTAGHSCMSCACRSPRSTC